MKSLNTLTVIVSLFAYGYAGSSSQAASPPTTLNHASGTIHTTGEVKTASITDHLSDPEELKFLGQKWNELAKAKDASGMVDLYAEGARSFPPNAAPVEGKEALLSYWESIVGLPQIEYVTTDDRFHIADDQAWVSGTYIFNYVDGGEEIHDKGKYVVIYEKQNGHWKRVLDMDSSNGSS